MAAVDLSSNQSRKLKDGMFGDKKRIGTAWILGERY
jgi:hypothetical protein